MFQNSNQINRLCKECHQDSIDKGFYQEPREFGTHLALLHSEISEALEADRKGRHSNIQQFYDAIAPFPEHSEEMFCKLFEQYVKDTVEDELADVAIRLFDLCGYLGIDLEAHITAKRDYNFFRPYKNGKEY